MTDVFTGFPSEGLDFLAELGERDKEWFTANRSTYDRLVVGPTRAFVEAIGIRLTEEVSSGIVYGARTNQSIAPINNDLRFSPDKSPYKDHLLLWFWEGSDKKQAPTLALRMSRDDVGFATGAMLGDLDRWRQLIDDEVIGQSLVSALERLGEGRALDLDGEGYKRVPKPYPPDHPRADLLRHKGFQARWPEPMPASVSTPGFVEHCVERLAACREVHQWLVTNL